MNEENMIGSMQPKSNSEINRDKYADILSILSTVTPSDELERSGIEVLREILYSLPGKGNEPETSSYTPNDLR